MAMSLSLSIEEYISLLGHARRHLVWLPGDPDEGDPNVGIGHLINRVAGGDIHAVWLEGPDRVAPFLQDEARRMWGQRDPYMISDEIMATACVVSQTASRDPSATGPWQAAFQAFGRLIKGIPVLGRLGRMTLRVDEWAIEELARLGVERAGFSPERAAAGYLRAIALGRAIVVEYDDEVRRAFTAWLWDQAERIEDDRPLLAADLRRFASQLTEDAARLERVLDEDYAVSWEEIFP